MARFDAFTSHVATLASPLGPLLLGVVDAKAPGVSAAISRLLFRSIGDARATKGGHLPDWLVDDVERNYISPAKVETLWAAFGHRFVVVHEDAIVGTVHVTKTHDTIFTIDRVVVNVSAREHPGFKPEGFHHLVNLSVKHELRRARIAMRMIDGITSSFRSLFDGEGLWVRGDPPWHVGLVGLGFEHDPSMDIFLPESAERTAGLPHAELNRRSACTCVAAHPQKPERIAERAKDMVVKKLQYVSFTRRFDATPLAVAAPKARPLPPEVAALSAELAEASAARTPIRIEGAGFGAPSWLSPPDEPARRVISTRALTGIAVADDGRSVTVQGGTTWRVILDALAPRGLLPPVVPALLEATVGGTLATAGIGKGSHRSGLLTDHVIAMTVATADGRIVACNREQAAWLFEATLGGIGTTGAIVDATLPLAPFPARVRVEKSAPSTVSALADALGAARRDPSTFHVTAWRAQEQRDGWCVARTVVTDGGDGSIATHDYLTEPAVTLPRDRDRAHLHVIVPSAHLVAWLEVLTGMTLQIVPLPEGFAVFAAIDRAHAPAGAPLFERAEALGAVRLDIPRRRDGSARARSLADPEGVLRISARDP